ncbi:MAG: ribosomal protein S18-alanine N-acetyltransferase [Firmicutes bacterium]|nr:ribosomal protein S18-alanine N-acetyltransferase [Bacillota bacterium]
MEVLIRRADEGDIKAITELEAICFRGEDPWSEAAFYNEIVENRDKTLYLVALIDEKIVGYMGLWRILDEGHITNVAVDPEFRRNHIGEAIIGEMMRRTSEGGTESWTLEVRVDNEPAIRLYEKMGFRSAGIRPKYYEYDGTDALIMWKGKE